MTLHVFDHRLRAKRPFVPVRPDRVGLYVCGLTVQDKPHLGHMFAFVACDMIRRHLEYRGYHVVHVQNFTDIDDKIIERARREGTSPAAVLSSAPRYRVHRSACPWAVLPPPVSRMSGRNP